LYKKYDISSNHQKVRDVVCKMGFCFLVHTRWSNVI